MAVKVNPNLIQAIQVYPDTWVDNPSQWVLRDLFLCKPR